MTQKLFTQLQDLTTYAAELDYALLCPLGDLTGNSGMFKGAFKLPGAANVGIAFGWNYLDAIYTLEVARRQLLSDKTHYLYSQQRVQAILNIFSSVQAFCFTYNPFLTSLLHLSSATTFAAPAFALSCLCDAVNATIDYIQAAKEATFEGWLIERLKELQFLRRKTNACPQKIAQLKRIVIARGRVYLHEKTNFKEHHVRKNFLIQQCNALFDKEMIYFFQTPSLDEQKLHHTMQTELKQNYQKARTNLAMKTISFIGMTCLAVAPFVSFCPPLMLFLGVAGLALTSLVTLYYAIKNAPKLGTLVKNGVQTLHGKLFNTSTLSRARDSKLRLHPSPA